MSNPTSNFNWQMPTNTDLVSQLPADFEVFGQAVDTSLADLRGGTTGQILAKNTNADMDFVWTTAAPGDITGVAVTSPITGGGTSGDVTIGISSSAVVPAQSGQSGKYLTTDGTTSSWGTISAGGMTLLSTTSMSSSSQINLTSISGSYKDLIVLIQATSWSGSDSEMRMLFNASNVAYGWGAFNAVVDSFNADNLKFTLATNTQAGQVGTYYCLIKDYASTTSHKPFNFAASAVTTGGSRRSSFGGGAAATNSAITSLRFETAHANTFSAGTILLYGAN